MDLVLSIVVGVLFGAGAYLMTRRSIVRLAVGLALLSHAANLLVFSAGGVVRGRPPIVRESGQIDLPQADPVPQALVLTAIVIGFATLAFFLVLIHRTYEAAATDDLDAMRTTDRL
jgi:multicomponent Na+:H+ antiporter subunit C